VRELYRKYVLLLKEIIEAFPISIALLKSINFWPVTWLLPRALVLIPLGTSILLKTF